MLKLFQLRIYAMHAAFALLAKRGNRGILREARRRGEKEKIFLRNFFLLPSFRDSRSSCSLGKIPRPPGWAHKTPVIQAIAIHFNASVNSTCAQAPPGLTPGNEHFFCLGWQIRGGGDSWAGKSPRVGTKKEGKCTVLRQQCNILYWSHSPIVPF